MCPSNKLYCVLCSITPLIQQSLNCLKIRDVIHLDAVRKGLKNMKQESVLKVSHVAIYYWQHDVGAHHACEYMWPQGNDTRPSCYARKKERKNGWPDLSGTLALKNSFGPGWAVSAAVHIKHSRTSRIFFLEPRTFHGVAYFGINKGTYQRRGNTGHWTQQLQHTVSQYRNKKGACQRQGRDASGEQTVDDLMSFIIIDGRSFHM